MNTYRTGEIYHLPAIIGSNSIPSRLYELMCEDVVLDEIFPFLSIKFLEWMEGWPPRYEIEEILCDLLRQNYTKPFLVRFECPVLSQSGSWSWSHYQAEYALCADEAEIRAFGEEMENRLMGGEE